MYDYLIGTGLLGIIWLILFLVRKDLRTAMLWSGKYYTILLSIGFVGFRLAVHDPARSITPGYWAPPTLFNLGHLTGGYGIEDALFMFFTAGIAAASYEFVFRRTIIEKPVKELRKWHALRIGLLVAAVFFVILHVNGMYLLIGFNLFSALMLLWLRRDLIVQSLWGGLLFLLVYSAMFLTFNNLLFPHFVATYYHLELTSRHIIFGVPLEEYAYAFAFGMLWAPLYEYKHQFRNGVLKAENN